MKDKDKKDLLVLAAIILLSLVLAWSFMPISWVW